MASARRTQAKILEEILGNYKDITLGIGLYTDLRMHIAKNGLLRNFWQLWYFTQFNELCYEIVLK